jgi:hypothetical protein
MFRIVFEYDDVAGTRGLRLDGTLLLVNGLDAKNAPVELERALDVLNGERYVSEAIGSHDTPS